MEIFPALTSFYSFLLNILIITQFTQKRINAFSFKEIHVIVVDNIIKYVIRKIIMGLFSKNYDIIIANLGKQGLKELSYDWDYVLTGYYVVNRNRLQSTIELGRILGDINQYYAMSPLVDEVFAKRIRPGRVSRPCDLHVNEAQPDWRGSSFFRFWSGRICKRLLPHRSSR